MSALSCSGAITRLHSFPHCPVDRKSPKKETTARLFEGTSRVFTIVYGPIIPLILHAAYRTKVQYRNFAVLTTIKRSG